MKKIIYVKTPTSLRNTAISKTPSKFKLVPIATTALTGVGLVAGGLYVGNSLTNIVMADLNVEVVTLDLSQYKNIQMKMDKRATTNDKVAIVTETVNESNEKVAVTEPNSFSFADGRKAIKAWYGKMYTQDDAKEKAGKGTDCIGLVDTYLAAGLKVDKEKLPKNAQCMFRLLKANNLMASNTDVVKWNKTPDTIPKGAVVFYDHGVGTKVHHVGIRASDNGTAIYQAKSSGYKIKEYPMGKYLSTNNRRIAGVYMPSEKPLQNDILVTEDGTNVASILNIVKLDDFNRIKKGLSIGVTLQNGVTI